MRQKESPVSPSFGRQTYNLYPIEGGLGVQQSDEQARDEELEEEHGGNEMEDLADKYEELKAKVEPYFDDNNYQSKPQIPVARAPNKPSKEEWLQHQATHTPYPPRCKHCVAARAVRHAHPSKGRRTAVAKDVEETDDQMAKISIDYMYIRERTSQVRTDHYNPPQLVMVDHREGRCVLAEYQAKESWKARHGCREGSHKILTIVGTGTSNYSSSPTKNRLL